MSQLHFHRVIFAKENISFAPFAFKLYLMFPRNKNCRFKLKLLLNVFVNNDRPTQSPTCFFLLKVGHVNAIKRCIGATFVSNRRASKTLLELFEGWIFIYLFCRVAAVKCLPVQHHSADYLSVPLDH